MVDAIKSSIELSLLFTRENKVFGLEASPEVVDQFELLVWGESSKIDRRLGHPSILAHQAEVAKSHPRRLPALANDLAFSGGAQAPSVATRGSAASRSTSDPKATPQEGNPLGPHLTNRGTPAIGQILKGSQ